MLRWIIEASLRYRYLVLGIAFAVFIFGLQSMREMSVDVLPEFEPPKVELQTEALGLSAEEVESLITLNLEEFLAGTSWLESITSHSSPGLSSVLLTFEPGTDLMRARQLVQERLTLSYTMPNVSKAPVMLQPLSAANRVMMVGLTSNRMSPIDLSVLARWTLKPRLMGVPGVANVVLWGQRKRQLQVLIDPERLQTNNLTQNQIIRTAGEALWISPLPFLDSSVPGTGGWIDTPNQRLGIRHELPISTPEDLAKMPVAGTSFTLGDVADVVEGHPPMIGDAYINDDRGILLVVEKFPWARTHDVTSGIDEALDAMQQGLPGVTVHSSIFRSASDIAEASSNMLTMLLVVSAVLLIITGLCLMRWRPLAIAACALLISFLTVILILQVRGDPVNFIVLAGLGAALIVLIDDALGDVYALVHWREARKRGKRASWGDLIEATLGRRRPLLYGSLAGALVLAPIFALVGMYGAFFTPLVWSYYLAIFVSLMTAFTLVPAMAWLLLSPSEQLPKEAPLTGWLKKRVDACLSYVMKRPRGLAAIVGVFAVLGLCLLPFMETTTLPKFKERVLLVDVEAIPGTSHDEIQRVMTLSSEQIRSIPGVVSVGAQMGRAVAGDQRVNMNSGQLWIALADFAPYQVTVDAIKESLSAFEGLNRKVKTYMRQQAEPALAGRGDTLVVRLYGPEREILDVLADQAADILDSLDGLSGVRVKRIDMEPELQVQVDLERAQKHGILPGDVRRAAATVFAGIEVGSLFEDQKVFDVVVWGNRSARESISRLENLLIDTPSGGHVRLADVADITLDASPGVIRHEGVSSYIDVEAEVHARSYRRLREEMLVALDTLRFPLEYHSEILDDYAQAQAQRWRVFAISCAAGFGVFLLLQSALHSWVLALAVFLVLPFSVIGGLFTAFAGGASISMGSLLGLFAVYSLSARQSLGLLCGLKVQHLKKGHMLTDKQLREGVTGLSTGTLFTTGALFVALLPWAFVGPIAGLEILHPMVVAMVGGLVSSLAVTLLIIPLLYQYFGESIQDEEQV